MYINNLDNFKINFVSDIQPLKRKKYFNTEPYHCHVCKRAWQHYANYYGKNATKAATLVEYLKGFPKFGCSKKICKNCEKK